MYICEGRLSHIPTRIVCQGVAGCLIGNPGKKPRTLERRQEKLEKQETLEKQEKTSNLKSGVQASDTHPTPHMTLKSKVVCKRVHACC